MISLCSYKKNEELPFIINLGNTGQPKGVTLTHHGMINNAYAVGNILGYDEVCETKNILLNILLEIPALRNVP